MTVGQNGVSLLIDSASPNWLATDERGEDILSRFDGRRSLGQIVKQYAIEHGLEWATAWQHVETIIRDALRQEMLSETPVRPGRYPGRAAFLNGLPLTELWIHTNNLCNLSCSHCLVSSGPGGNPGLPLEKIVNVVEQARALGTRRFYLTGGEPLVRKDIVSICQEILEDGEAELAILTNGTLFRGARYQGLKALDRERVRLQISLDGSRPETNDRIRGRGSFERITAGIRTAIADGFHVTVTTAIAQTNADDVPGVTRLISRLGGTRHHLLWLHKRGRADGSGPDFTPPVDEVIQIVRRARAAGQEVGVTIDNFESMKERLNAPARIKRDLSNACVQSLCMYSDGSVYPSAATVNIPELRCGSVLEQPLAEIWKESAVSKSFREATVEKKPQCPACPLKYLCGGGDIEHAYFYTGSIDGHDPYCELHKAMIRDAFGERAEERRSVLANGKSGFSSPIAFTGMGEGAVHCATNEEISEVLTSHSECVRSFELDAPRKVVRDFYGDAAETPQEDLCCPIKPLAADIAHIPREVVERFYGCGSPVGIAQIQPGETTLDLGSGAGIDVFTAAKKVGPGGKSIGVDMTDAMLQVARENQSIVAGNLGYDAVSFRKGFLEDIPAETASIDLVTSNCVINLSPDKKRVFAEMWRVLRDHGRIVVSDIVSEEAVPSHQRRDPRLWGECISGALTEEEFLALLERAGFYGVAVLRRTFWKEVEGHRFFSVTVRGYKFEKKAGCVYRGQHATYQGPFKGATDDEGHFFPRGVAVEVCTDTAAKLSRAPYAGMFLIADPTDGDQLQEFACCEDAAGCC
jgi:radical SAM protein with 4Fe4S-binding SPASM domain